MNEKLTIPALVLEGGAMRGMYTAGVLDTFMDLGITAAQIVGVSAGALFGVNFLSGQRGRAIRYNKRFNSDRSYLGLLPLLKEGSIVSTDYAYRRVPHELDPFDDKTFRASPGRFYAVVTDLATGQPEYIRISSVFEQMDVLRASGSMPFVSRPVRLNGKEYLDGAVSDSIPFEWAAAHCAERPVVILTRDIHYRKKPSSGIFAGLYKRKYPRFAQAFAGRHTLYTRQIDTLRRWELEGKAFVIRPSEPIDISRTERDPKKLQAVYELGIRDAKACAEKLKKFLTETGSAD